MAEVKEGSGVLFLNRRKDQPRQPDFRGNIFLCGMYFDLAAWKNYDKTGEAYFSLNARPARVPRPIGEKELPKPAEPPLYQPPAANPSSADTIEITDDDIPF